MFANPNLSAIELATKLNVIQDSDEGKLKEYISQVIELNPKEVERYVSGEKQLVGFFMGQLMKVSQGKADPKQSNALMRKMLDELN
jgi:aspartyl-tRNA(Asn)/glutamyl-tRNA(Gln) amidotransferase subunit B